MPTLPIPPIEVGPDTGFVSPAVLPLDQRVWDSWVHQGQAEERRRAVIWRKAVTLACGLLLLGCSAWWPMGEPFASAVRFLVSGGALVIALRAYREGHVVAPLFFAAMAILFNPVIPLFPLAGEWSRSLMIGSAIPFFAALGWRSGPVR